MKRHGKRTPRRKTMTPADVRALARKHPELTVSQLAERAGVTYQGVQSALRHGDGGRGRPALRTVGQTIKDVEARRGKVAREKVAGKGISARHRALRLVAVLLERPAGATVADLLEAVGCSRATLYRYRDDAIAAGLTITIDASAGRGVEGAWVLNLPRVATDYVIRGAS